VTGIAAGGAFSVALRNDRTVRTWGDNAAGQLGDGTSTQRTTPVVPVNATGILQITAGGFHTFARRDDGAVLAWGRGGMVGQGADFDSTVPIVLPFLRDLKTISSSLDHTVAMMPDGRIFAWGSNLGQEL